jgi:hypothetical protein
LKITWKIRSIKAQDGLITQAMYEAVATEKDLVVDTEGTWFFREPKINVAFAKVTEEMIVGWIKSETSEDGKSIIEKRLTEQLKALAAQQETPLPWMPQVFTPKIEE